MREQESRADHIDKVSLICVTCPVGCPLEVTVDGSQVVAVEGHGCKRGLAYAQDEITDPRRVVTTTIRVSGGLHPLLPVHTADPYPKHMIFAVLQELRGITVTAPTSVDQVILKDALRTGIDVLASRDMPEER